MFNNIEKSSEGETTLTAFLANIPRQGDMEFKPVSLESHLYLRDWMGSDTLRSVLRGRRAVMREPRLSWESEKTCQRK